MKKRNILFLVAALLLSSFMILQFGCKKVDEDNEPQNSPPEIQSITSTPNTSSSNRLPAGEQATISVTATDPDKDNLSYSWEADGGNFDGATNQSSVSWQSPMSTSLEKYKITATVSDGAETTSKSIDIYVDKLTPGINVIPKNFDFGTELTEIQTKIFNTGEGQLKWETYVEGASWLVVNPTSGTINTPYDTAYVTLTVDRDGMNPNSYTEDFRFRNSDDYTNYVTINVSMEVAETASLEGYTYYASTTIPVSGVLVKVGESSSTTGSDGYYEISDVLTGGQTLTATKEGYDTYSTNIQIGSGTNEYNIEMTSALYTHNLYGIITDELTGNPISYVNVVVLNPDGTESDLKTQSSSSGYYQVPTVPQGERTIRFSHDEYDEAEINIFMANSNYELNFHMNTCLPVVSTGNYEVIYPLVVEVNGNITSLGCSEVTQHGHCWSTYPNPTTSNEKTELGSTSNLGNYISEVKYLSENTQYYVRAYATNSYGTFYANEIVFTTSSFPDCGTVSYGGKTYETVVIGEQCWIKENLNYQTSSGSWCYGNSSVNCEIYGRLYTWSTMMDGESSSNSVPSGVQGICPTNWHVPSDAEWDNLVNYLGGASIAGGKMKETGTIHWNSPNVGATNSSGFTGLPGGCRFYGSWSFDDLGHTGYWWSSSEYSGSLAWRRYLYYFSVDVGQHGTSKGDGFSVRCLKD